MADDMSVLSSDIAFGQPDPTDARGRGGRGYFSPPLDHVKSTAPHPTSLEAVMDGLLYFLERLAAMVAVLAVMGSVFMLLYQKGDFCCPIAEDSDNGSNSAKQGQQVCLANDWEKSVFHSCQKKVLFFSIAGIVTLSFTQGMMAAWRVSAVNGLFWGLMMLHNLILPIPVLAPVLAALHVYNRLVRDPWRNAADPLNSKLWANKAYFVEALTLKLLCAGAILLARQQAVGKDTRRMLLASSIAMASCVVIAMAQLVMRCIVGGGKETLGPPSTRRERVVVQNNFSILSDSLDQPLLSPVPTMMTPDHDSHQRPAVSPVPPVSGDVSLYSLRVFSSSDLLSFLKKNAGDRVSRFTADSTSVYVVLADGSKLTLGAPSVLRGARIESAASLLSGAMGNHLIDLWKSKIVPAEPNLSRSSLVRRMVLNSKTVMLMSWQGDDENGENLKTELLCAIAVKFDGFFIHNSTLLDQCLQPLNVDANGELPSTTLLPARRVAAAVPSDRRSSGVGAGGIVNKSVVLESFSPIDKARRLSSLEKINHANQGLFSAGRAGYEVASSLPALAGRVMRSGRDVILGRAAILLCCSLTESSPRPLREKAHRQLDSLGLSTLKSMSGKESALHRMLSGVELMLEPLHVLLWALRVPGAEGLMDVPRYPARASGFESRLTNGLIQSCNLEEWGNMIGAASAIRSENDILGACDLLVCCLNGARNGSDPDLVQVCEERLRALNWLAPCPDDLDVPWAEVDVSS